MYYGNCPWRIIYRSYLLIFKFTYRTKQLSGILCIFTSINYNIFNVKGSVRFIPDVLASRIRLEIESAFICEDKENCYSIGKSSLKCSRHHWYWLHLLVRVIGIHFTGLQGNKSTSFKRLCMVWQGIVILVLAWISFYTWPAVK